jgi:Amt family ammonium transporter
LIKNVATVAVGAIGWTTFGWALAFGEDNHDAVEGGGFIGTDQFFVQADKLNEGDGSTWAGFLFQFMFCATGATIVSGGMAERCRLEGYVLFALAMCLFIYPIVVHWTWAGGWLGVMGFNDFAGSGVVHMTGGFSALWGAAILGPRTGRFDKSFENTPEFAPGSVLAIVLGVFILWFGWFGFNAGSTTALSGGAAAVAARAAVTTTVSGATGGITGFIISTKLAGKYDVPGFCNGILIGLVSITAGCYNVDVWAAAVIGVIGGILLLPAMMFLEKIKVDDPISAFPVHGVGGFWGVLAAGLFDVDVGAFYGGAVDDCLGPNLIGACAIIAWTLVTASPVFLALKAAGLLRYSDAQQINGLDMKFTAQSPAVSMAHAIKEAPSADKVSPEEA